MITPEEEEELRAAAAEAGVDPDEFVDAARRREDRAPEDEGEEEAGDEADDTASSNKEKRPTGEGAKIFQYHASLLTVGEWRRILGLPDEMPGHPEARNVIAADWMRKHPIAGPSAETNQSAAEETVTE